VLEEFGPDLQYIKDTCNVVGDALSRLEIDDEQETFIISECFGYDDDDLPPSSFPLQDKDIAKAHELIQLYFKKSKIRVATPKLHHGGDKEHKLICHNGKIALLRSPQQKMIDWYHEILCHPGKTRTEETI
jgi:hypothetical protein